MTSDLNKEAWDAKVIELGGSILQSWIWGEFQQSLQHKLFRFSGDDYCAQSVRIGLPLGKAYIYSPRGPLGNASEALKDFRNLASDHTLVFARLEPSQKLDLPRSAKETQPQDNWVLDITPTPEQLLVRMKSKTRYNINLAQKRGVVVREGGKQDMLSAYKLFLETAHRGGFRLHPQNYYWQMFELLSPQFLKLLVAEYQGQVLACMLLTLFGDTATYLHGGSSSKQREVMAPYLLHWEAINVAKNLGLSTYDFGGISNDVKNHPTWVGLTRFKKSFGGFEVSYPGSFDLVYSSIWYNAYKNVRVLRNIIKRG